MNQEIIDCQIHCGTPSLEDIYPYMESGWVDRFRRVDFHLPPVRGHSGRLESPADPLPSAIPSMLGPNVRAAVAVPHQALPTANWTDTRTCAVFASALNGYMVDHVLPADPRLRLALAISPHEPHLAAAEIEKHAGNPRVVAAVMPMLATHLGATHYRPILEAAARHNIVLVIHPTGKEGTVTGTPALGGIGPRFVGEHDCLVWQVAAVNISSLIYDGLFAEFPDLVVAFADFGFEWLAPVQWRLDAEWRALRVDVPWVTEPPSAYVGRNIRILVSERGETPEKEFAHLASIVPPSSLMFGSNRPFETEPPSWLELLPDETRERVAWKNAAETFGERLTAAPIAAGS